MADAIEAIFKAVHADKECAEWVIEGGIKACFDKIDHEWLKENIPLYGRTGAQWTRKHA